MNDEAGGQDGEPVPTRSGRYSVSPRLTYLLIAGAALGLIAAMCLIVALIVVIQNA
jgi:hypothetical protein